jgi:hypothetical protein
MAKKDALLKELDWITEKISSQVWTLNVGALGTAWSLLIANRFSIRNAVWVFVPSLLSLLCEMAQYLSGYWLDRRLLAEMERNNRDEFHYPKRSFLYRARQFFFW